MMSRQGGAASMPTGQDTAELATFYRTGDVDTEEERSAEMHLWRGELVAAYHALGAEPPDVTPSACDRGVHPIKLEAERQYQEQVGLRVHRLSPCSVRHREDSLDESPGTGVPPIQVKAEHPVEGDPSRS